MRSTAKSATAGPLRPAELAGAGVMAALATGLVVVGSVIPHAGPLQLLAVVPYGVITQRHRPRAAVAALVAGALVTVLVVGVGGGISLVSMGLLGGFVGELKRRRRGIGTVWLSAAVLAPACAALAIGVLWLATSSRTLALDSLRGLVIGIGNLLRQLGPLRPAGEALVSAADSIVTHWMAWVGLGVLLGTVVLLIISWILIGRVLDRVRWVGGDGLAHAVSNADVRQREAGGEPDPIPVELTDVRVRHGANDVFALDGVDLLFPPGQFVAVTGENGSGKSTLAWLLAGCEPTNGTIRRSGPVGLGRPGGTAMITQRPDVQVIGLRVADDVRWGIPPSHEVDVTDLLSTVGLAGMADRDTSTLSGGQLQRLAIAAALARRPRLLISDESTAMLDPDGRREVIRLYQQQPRRWPMTVVHVTHHEAELAAADRVIHLHAGRVIADYRNERPEGQGQPAQTPIYATTPNDEPQPPDRSAQCPSDGVTMVGIGHTFAYGTVWQRRALDSITLTIGAGQGVLLVGENGSGKSTMAWILAGLLRPTEGMCLLDGQPTHRQRGSVGLAFQHARLQLQRPNVGSDIADAAGWRPIPRLERAEQISRALTTVGLDPALAGQSIERLSGGQQRRVALAGLLARNPRLLVLDEPLAGLDQAGKAQVVEVLRQLHERDGVTLIAISHDPSELAPVCERTLRLHRGRVVDDSQAATHAVASGSAMRR